MTTPVQVVKGELGDPPVAHIKGEIDASNAPRISATLRSMVSNRSEVLAVDLTDTTYLDSAGIALLFALASDLALHQQELRLVIAESSPIARMVTITGLDSVVTIFPTLDAATGA